DVVGHAADVADAPAERQSEDEDEQKRGEDRRGDRLRPQLQDAVGLAGGERDEAAVAADDGGHRFEASGLLSRTVARICVASSSRLREGRPGVSSVTAYVRCGVSSTSASTRVRVRPG